MSLCGRCGQEESGKKEALCGYNEKTKQTGRGLQCQAETSVMKTTGRK